MAITLAGTTGITTPGLTNSGNETITGTLNVGGLTPNVYPIVSGTAVASTSGTSIDFTSIPSWVKRITVMFSGVSTNGTGSILIQVGSGSITTTGYLGASVGFTAVNYSSGFSDGSGSAANTRYGQIVLCNLTGSTWTMLGVLGLANTANAVYMGGAIALGGTLDRVRITTTNGTDTFDAGTVNLLWE